MEGAAVIFGTCAEVWHVADDGGSFFVNTVCVGSVTLPVWTLTGFRNSELPGTHPRHGP